MYREAVHGGLGWVDDEVAQGEAEALGRAAQQHGLGPRPRELLVRRVRPRGRVAKASPLWSFILQKVEVQNMKSSDF